MDLPCHRLWGQTMNDELIDLAEKQVQDMQSDDFKLEIESCRASFEAENRVNKPFLNANQSMLDDPQWLTNGITAGEVVVFYIFSLIFWAVILLPILANLV